jgi:hypothetical protein
MRTKLLLFFASPLAIALSASAAETIKYGYDARGRLVSVARSGAVNDGVVSTYKFDKADNRTQLTVSGGATSPTLPSVPDSSFEQPEVGSSYVYNPPVSGVSFVSFAGVAGNGSDWGFLAAPDGDQVAFLRSDVGGTGSISHTITGLTSGSSYSVSFLAAQRPGYPVNPVSVKVDGATLGTYSPQSSSFAQFTTPAFTAVSASATLEFVGQASGVDVGTGIDKVVLAPAAASPSVPDSSFELPEVGSSYVYNPSVSGVSFASYSGVAGNGSDWGILSGAGRRPGRFLRTDVGGTASISHTITGLTSGSSYSV